MTGSIYQFVLGRLQQSKGHWPAVAEGSGVSLRTIAKIARKEIEDPGVSHVEKLADFFRSKDGIQICRTALGTNGHARWQMEAD